MDRAGSLRQSQKFGITLIELLTAISLLSAIALGLTSIDLFTRHHVISSDRRAKLQNEVSFALDHISKSLARAIGNIPIDHVNDTTLGTDIIDTVAVAEPGDPAGSVLKIYVDGPDSTPDGKRGAGDYRVAYRFRDSSAALAAEKNRLEYCANYIFGGANSYEVIANRITSFSAALEGYVSGNPASGSNSLNISLTACWDPAQARYACGAPDNPSVTMSGLVYMPSVSTN